MLHVSIMLPLLLFVVVMLIAWFVLKAKQTTEIDVSDNILLVTAHPDDELMFFGPTLLQEIRARALQTNQTKPSKVHLLCLCNGDFYGDGSKRIQELIDACNFLVDYCVHFKRKTFDSEIFAVKVVQDKQLQDSPALIWSSQLIQQHVTDYIRDHQINKVITFDQFGVSGHSNHVSIHNALAKSFNASVQLWQLQTVPLWRKYLSLFDIFFTCVQSIFDHNFYVHLISPLDYYYLVQALRHHQSQMLWFRYLYLFTSRYMFINNLSRF